MSEHFMASEASKNKLFKVEHLFGSQTRARLLGLFVHNPEQQFFVRELTRRIDAQLNSVRRELQNLIELGVIREVIDAAGGKGEKRKFYIVETEFVLFNDLRSLMKKIQLMMKKNLVQEIDEKGKIDLLVLTGRFVDNLTVPVDLLLVGSMQEPILQKLLQAFEKEFGQEVNYTVMTKEEYTYRKQISDRFLYSILNAEHMTMIDRMKK